LSTPPDHLLKILKNAKISQFMDKERETFVDNPEEAIRIMKNGLMDFGLTEEALDKLNPYRWGSHIYRYHLWVTRNYIELVEPEDPGIRFQLLMGFSNMFTKQAAYVFRRLDENDNIESFKRSIQELGFKINQMCGTYT
jgi:hypothetical protein